MKNREKIGASLMLSGVAGLLVSFVCAFPYALASFKQTNVDEQMNNMSNTFAIVAVGLIVSIPLAATGNQLLTGSRDRSKESKE